MRIVRVTTSLRCPLPTLPMLRPCAHQPCSELDHRIFTATVPPDHYLRRVLQAVDFDRCRPLLVAAYDPALGRPACEPVLLLKLEFLEYHYNLSDRQVLDQARYSMAFRLFLGLSLDSELPDPSLLSYFRRRLGPERHQQVFDAVVGQAREHGLVKDRLRLKDATHVLANIAIPTTRALVAQARDRLLAAARPYAPERVAAEEAQAAAVRSATADLSGEERLLHRVVHLRAVVAWADGLAADLGPASDGDRPRADLAEALRLAHRVLADREGGLKAPDQLVSLHDQDARWGKHGQRFAGYWLDVATDADSALITAVNVLPANADEGADATTLIRHEEQAHGNDVQALSLDGAGFRGSLLREWTDPEGMNLEVIVPPRQDPATPYFPVERFTLNEARDTLVCPAGQTTQARTRSPNDTGWQYRFRSPVCAACPLRGACVGEAKPGRYGRTVVKNDYEAARAKAQTPRHREVRRQHRRVERKLGELVRWHRGRRARYRGRPRVLVQGLLTALVVNVKRVVRLLAAPRVRAALAASP